MSALKNNFLLAIDPSLKASGWTLFSLKSNLPVAVGVISPPDAKNQLANRLNVLQVLVTRLIAELKLGKGDILVCEGPAPLVKNPLSAIKVEGVRCIFEAVARSRLLCVPGRINPRTIQAELLGMKGKQLPRKTVKFVARDVALKMYSKRLQLIFQEREMDLAKISQDIIDSLLIGCLAISRVQLAKQTAISIEAAFVSKTWSKKRSRDGKSLGWSEADVRKVANLK